MYERVAHPAVQLRACYGQKLKLEPELTAVGFITHVSAVRPVVTHVLHQDARSIATPVLVRHAGSDHRRYWERGAVTDQTHASQPISATETQVHPRGGQSTASQTQQPSRRNSIR